MALLLPRGLLAIAAAVAAVAAAADESAGDGSCAAGSACGAEPHYYWPGGRGRNELPGRSPYRGPKDLAKSLAWKWNHPLGQYAVVLPAAPLIDDRKNIYLSTTEQVYSFDSDGNTRWVYQSDARMSDTGAISNGLFYFVTGNGFLHALGMSDGLLRWKKQLAPEGIGGDIATMGVYEGRVITSVGMSQHGGSAYVVCANATDGEELWKVKPESGLWNFLPIFPGDGKMVFQTENGDPFVVRVSDGTVLWTKKREGLGWTDGGTMVGPNGVAYVVHAYGHIVGGGLRPEQPSDITAYRVEDGKQLWRHSYPTPPNSWPAVAPMGDEKRQTVLFPYGGQAYTSPVQIAWGRLGQWGGLGMGESAYLFANWLYLKLGSWGPLVYKWLLWIPNSAPMGPWPGGVTAFEPDSGRVRWEVKLPDWHMPEVKGDDVGLAPRTGFVLQGKLFGQSICIPNPWSSPTVDADGTAYLGFQDGFLYAMRERGGKGEISDRLETTAGFSHPGAAMAPGMLAIANCDTLYVFKYDE